MVIANNGNLLRAHGGAPLPTYAGRRGDARREPWLYSKGAFIVAIFIRDKAVILVGADYSQNSNDALEAACGFAGTRPDVVIHIVHLARPSAAQPFAGLTQPFAATTDPGTLDELQGEARELEALTQRAAASVLANSARFFGHLRTGNAAREIVQLASDLSADLIVVGTHGRTGVLKLLLGSVAQTVLTNASCPVLVVKPRGLPQWPAIEPPCPDCVDVQKSSQGQRLWCERHAQHHAHAHTYSAHPEGEGYGLGAQTFRGLA
jgi:nucleotide-binding universal stress UspA family protein